MATNSNDYTEYLFEIIYRLKNEVAQLKAELEQAQLAKCQAIDALKSITEYAAISVLNVE